MVINSEQAMDREINFFSLTISVLRFTKEIYFFFPFHGVNYKNKNRLHNLLFLLFLFYYFIILFFTCS